MSKRRGPLGQIDMDVKQAVFGGRRETISGYVARPVARSLGIGQEKAVTLFHVALGVFGLGALFLFGGAKKPPPPPPPNFPPPGY